MPDELRPDVVERVATAHGEWVLRRVGRHQEVVANGMFLMDTRDGRSERLLATATLDAVSSPPDAVDRTAVLVGGLGVGFTLEAVLGHPAAGGASVTVVELEPALVRWHRTGLLGDPALLADPRVHLVEADLLAVLADMDRQWDVICLDVDNGPDWTVVDANRALYDDAGTARLRDRLRPGGALGVWGARPAPGYDTVLRRHFRRVDIHQVPVSRGDPDVVWVART